MQRITRGVVMTDIYNNLDNVISCTGMFTILHHTRWFRGLQTAARGKIYKLYTCIYIYIYTGLLKMIVRVLTTCHTQYT